MSLGFGSSSSGPAYKSPNMPEYERESADYVRNRAGIKKVVNPEYQKWVDRQNSYQSYPPQNYGGAPGQVMFTNDAMGRGPSGSGNRWSRDSSGAVYYAGSEKAPDQYIYDTSNAGKAVSKDEAMSPYSSEMSAYDRAMSAFGNPYQFSQTYKSNYNPTKYTATSFNYQGLPQKYADEAFAVGSKDIRRQGQGDLQSIQEAVGARRPGLLLRAGQKSQRDIAEQLASMRGNIDLERMRQQTDLGVKQQQDQAAENMRAAQFGEGQEQFRTGEGAKEYQSRSDLEKSQAGENFQNKQALAGAAKDKIATEAAIQNQTQEQNDKVLSALLQYYLSQANAGTSNGSQFNFKALGQ